MENKLDLINKEIREFENEDIPIVNGCFFNQFKIIQRIHRYLNSKFENGDIDTEGDKKYFYNICLNPCFVVKKAIDFDTKNIRLLTAQGGEPLKTWFLEKDLIFWMKDQQFGKILNGIFDKLPKFGSVVLKIVNNKPYFIDLRNFIVDQSADSLEQSNYIIERYFYSPQEFKKTAKEMGWETKQVYEEFKKMKEKRIAVYERYGEIDGSFKKIFLADVGTNEMDRYNNLIAHQGIVLQEGEITEIPYWEFHFEKIPGRWLGRGAVELLFEPQTRINEIINLRAKGSYWNAARVFQTRDTTISKNLKTDVLDGQVIGIENEITQIDMGDRNLAFFSQEIQDWSKNAVDLSLSYDVISGERLPAGTPLGSARLAAGMTQAYFDQIREDIALDIKELLFEIIIPNFQNKNNAEHILRLTGNDLDKINTMIVNQKSVDELFNFLIKNNHLPNQQQYDVIKSVIGENVKQGKEKLLTIPKNFYKDLKYKIEIDITGESVDSSARAASLFAALQAVTADPTLLSDPMKKKFFLQWLEMGGIAPMDFIEESIPQISDIQFKGAGGGVSRPTPQQMPVGTMAQQTL